MLELDVELENFREFGQLLRDLPEIWDIAVQDTAKTVRNLVIGRTPVKTGHLKSSWSDIVRTGRGSFSFGTDVDYATILEEGGYRSVGPRTVATEGGIYSRQAPGGIIGPLLQDSDTLDQISRVVAEELLRGIRDASP